MVCTVIGLLVWVSGCGQGRRADDYLTVEGPTMGTYYLVRYRGSADCLVGVDEIEARLAEINRAMSTYDPESEISLINNAAEPVRVSRDLQIVMQAARQVWRETDGAFDITVGPLIDLWGFGPKTVSEPPSIDAQQAAGSRVGMEKVRLEDGRIHKSHAAVAMDLSAIAKGYAVDELYALLSAKGCRHFMIDIGGEMRLVGNNPQEAAWRVGIEAPDSNRLGGVHRVLHLSGVGVATSGDYRNYIESESGRVDHVFDPRSRRPSASAVVSATVVHDTAMHADAYATAMMVLGADVGLALADRLGFAVYLLVAADVGAAPDVREVEPRYNTAMQTYLNPPTSKPPSS